MKSVLAALVVATAGFVAGQAQADNSLYLTADYVSTNAAQLSVTGDYNVARVAQSFDGLGGGNRLQLAILGNLNNSLMAGSFGGPLSASGLVPGQLIQTGHDNLMHVNVTGSQNLFAASQVGTGNMLTAMVIGNNNQAAVVQSGSGNSLSFTQNGTGNRLMVTQRSY